MGSKFTDKILDKIFGYLFADIANRYDVKIVVDTNKELALNKLGYLEKKLSLEKNLDNFGSNEKETYKDYRRLLPEKKNEIKNMAKEINYLIKLEVTPRLYFKKANLDIRFGED